MNIRELKYFIEVCNQKSTLAASKTLFITQQALSKSIKKLEQELNVLLFNRIQNKLVLTKDGQYLYSYASKIVRDYDEFQYHIYSHFNSDKIHLKLGVAPGVLRSLGMSFLDYPDYNIQIVEAYDSICEERVISGDLDFALSTKPIDNPLLSFIFIKSEPLFWLQHISSNLLNINPLYFKDLLSQKIVLCDKQLNLHKLVENEFAKYNAKPQILFQVNEIEVILQLVNNNIGGNICAQHVFDSVVNLSVFGTRLQDECASWDIGVIYKKHTMPNYKFIEYIQRHAKKTF